MNLRNLPSLVVLSLGLLCNLSANAQRMKPPGFHELKIGEAAPDFKLMGVDDRYWTLDDLKEHKLLVVYFTSNHCPSATLTIRAL
ncbi:MAG: redoxin domain-containing protein [Planctomycetota bacterium]